MESELVLPGNNSALGRAQDRRTRTRGEGEALTAQPSPAWGGHHQPQCGRAHTLPKPTLRPCPRAAGRPGPPLSTPRLKVAVVERKRGEAGAGRGVPGYQETGS